MGGSGGGGFFRGDVASLWKQLQEAAQESEEEAYASEISSYLGELLTDVNDRDTEAVRRYLKTITQALEKDIEGTVEYLFGGSVAKHTYVEGLSDIDALVLLDESELGAMGPEAALDYLEQRLEERFPNHKVERGSLAVTIPLKNAEVQLLPALRSGEQYLISNPDAEGWLQIEPDKFARRLTEANTATGRKVVPTVKLVKAIIGGLPEGQRITGYHSEALAVDVFEDYSGQYRLDKMVKNFFSRASERVLAPMVDPSGQSEHVDDYLGPRKSTERRVRADAFKRIVRRIESAENAGSTTEWKRLFSEEIGAG